MREGGGADIFAAAEHCIGMGSRRHGNHGHMARRARRGFDKYPFVQDQERGIWATPNGDKAAWFKDADGNVLIVSQHV